MTLSTTPRRARAGTAFLAMAVLLLFWSVRGSRAAEPDDAAAYDQAYRLEQNGKTAEAAEAYRKYAEQYPGTSMGLTAQAQLAGLLAVQGQTDESLQVYAKQAENELKASGTPPEKWPPADSVRADARLKVAHALLVSRRPDRYVLARKQYEAIIATAPGSTQAAEAEKRMEGLKAVEEAQAAQSEKTRAIAAVLKAYESALREKNTSAALALLANPPKDKALVTSLEAYFRGTSYRAYTYEIKKINLSPDASKATVTAQAVVSAKERTGKLFRLVETADGWKLESL